MNDQVKDNEEKILDESQVAEHAAESDEGTVDAAAELKAQRQRRAQMGKKKPQASKSVNPDIEERVVAVNRVAKVVKGGRRFSFAAIMVVGDKKGNVGFGLGKAKEVPEAIRKATQAAQKHMITVPIDRGTIPHEVIGYHDSGRILFKPAAEGTGIKAAGACRSILELAGIKNVLTKSLRGTNPHNVVKATFKALQSLRSIEQIAQVRGKEVKGLRLKQKA